MTTSAMQLEHAMPGARVDAPPTSRAAAASMLGAATQQRLRILASLHEHGSQTGNELDHRFGWHHATANRRLSELFDVGLVGVLSFTRPTDSGRQASVYALTVPGLAYLTEESNRARD